MGLFEFFKFKIGQRATRNGNDITKIIYPKILPKNVGLNEKNNFSRKHSRNTLVRMYKK